jgi:CheY-like chemotaxis protein
VVEAALATFAHEVRTPLTGILAISELLATSGLGERERHWVDTIKASAEHLAALATLFVDAAKGRTDRVSLRRDFFDLQTLARAAGDSLSGRAAAKGLTAQVSLARGLEVYVLGDAVRLRAALENLIDNAVKFTETGNVALKASLVKSPRGRIGVTFAVSDSGIGIRMADVKRLFRPFSQANVNIARQFGGAGLGLSSVRVLARAMGGDVAVVARRGGGTTFALTVLLDRASRQDAALLGMDVVKGDHAPVRARRILCVEDNPFGRVILNTILTELGHHPEFIGRGETVCDRLAEGDIDVVLMDIVLPGINGVETIRRIRAMPPPQGAVPIIGVSGRSTDEAAARAAGADAFLVKPVSPRALAVLLAEVGAKVSRPR